MLHRRDLIAAAATVPVAGVAGSFAQAKPVDPHPVWLVKWKEARVAWMAAEDGTPEDDALCAEEFRLVELIARTPPATIEGACAVLEMVLIESAGDFTYPVHEVALGNALKMLV